MKKVSIDFTAKFPASIHQTSTCPACLSKDIFYVGSFDTPYKINNIDTLPLIVCRECGTCMTPHNRCLDSTLEWHFSVEARNRNFSQKLLSEIQRLRPNCRRIVEIGCGVGWFLDEARKIGLDVVGYETTHLVAQAGVERLGLPILEELFTADFDEDMDVLVCISVLEHLVNPDDLLIPIAQVCKKKQALAVLSVPSTGDSPASFLANNIIPFLADVYNQDEKNLLRYVPAHVTHYSHVGFIKHLQRLNSTNIQRIDCHSWRPYCCSF